MAELDEIKSYIVNGYVFETRADYEDALQEKKGINYLSSQLNLNNIPKVTQLYTELIEKKVFVTPIGHEYLKSLRDVIVKSGTVTGDDLLPIPVITANKSEKGQVEKYVSTKYEATVKKLENENKKLKGKLSTAIYMCVALVVIVLVMFFITKNSSTPNILNYERKLQDKYSAWEQELKEKDQMLKDREWEIRQKEEALNSQK